MRVILTMSLAMFNLTRTAVPYFLYALGIILREGLEAILVIIALAAGTRNLKDRDGFHNRSRDVYAGAALAVVASVALAWVVNHVIGDDASDTLEGAFQFLAAATLFYVSSWLTSKSQANRWNRFIVEKVESARNSALPSIALGLTAFLAVIREGAETIVFFQALTAGTTQPREHDAVMLGIAAGAVGLAIIFWVLTRASHRIPLRSVFAVTSLMLYALAVIFIGQGVASWQEAGMVGATFIEHFPQIPALGIYPTVQSIAAQAILVVVAMLSYLLPRGGAEISVVHGAVKVEPQPAPSVTRPT
ncbi:MAG TPA: FTR1 family protein [Candidatus Binataceae bacterium]|nr:FTR1 family protein [Candidatus Binataceae bacterium]